MSAARCHCVRPSLTISLIVGFGCSLHGAELLGDRSTGLEDLAACAPVEKSSDSASIRDLRLGLGLVPGINKADFAAISWSGVEKVDQKPSWSATPAFAYGRFGREQLGLVAVVGLPYRTMAGNASNGDRFVVRSYGIEIVPALALRMDAQTHLELGIPLAAGFASHEVPGFSADRGEWWSTGVRLGGYWTRSSGVQYGAELGYLSVSTLGTLKDGSDRLDVTYHCNGLTAGLVLGYHF